MVPAKLGFLASIDTVRHADAMVDRLRAIAVDAHRLVPSTSIDEQADAHDDVSGLAAGISTGAVVGLGLGALAAVVVPGVGVVLLSGILASMAGFGSAGAAVGGLIGAMSGDQIVEETAQFIRRENTRGQTVVVVETDPRSHEPAILYCQSAGATLHYLTAADSAGLHIAISNGQPSQPVLAS